MLNVNLIKDGVYGDLSREVPGPGYVHLPDWVPEDYFDEITSEIRTPKGWEKGESHAANEDFDLHAYNRAMCIQIGAERIDWAKPPEWAMESEKRVALRAARAEEQKRQSTMERPPRRNWVTQW